MKIAVIGLIILGIVAAISAAVLVSLLSGGSRTQPLIPSVPPPPPTVSVVVASKPLAPWLTVQKDDVTVVAVLPNQVPKEEYFSSPSQVIGKILSQPISDGQMFTMKSFAAEGQVGPDVVRRLGPGKRAVNIPVTDLSGLDGIMYPGAVVDVVAMIRNVATSGNTIGRDTAAIVVRDVEVLAMDRQTVATPQHIVQGTRNSDADPTGAPGGIVPPARRVTLAVDTHQATELALAMQEATLTLALRNPRDTSLSDDKNIVSMAEELGFENSQQATARLLGDYTAALNYTGGQPPSGPMPTTSKAYPTDQPPGGPRVRLWSSDVWHGPVVEPKLLPMQ